MLQKNKRTQIKAPRANITPLNEGFVETSWRTLEKAIQEIFNKNASNLSYEELYRNAYNLVLQRFGETLYTNVENCMKKRLEGLTNCIVQALDETFLSNITEVWSDYRTASHLIKDILMYMDQNYVVQTEKKLFYDNSIYLFKVNIIENTSAGERVTNQVVDKIQLERNGSVIDRGLLKAVSSMLDEMKCYEDVIEKRLLEVSVSFYRDLAEKLSQSKTVPDYLQFVQERLKEEVDRVNSYLVQTSRSKLEEIIRDEMITKRMSYILDDANSGFVCLVRDDKLKDLERMFHLFSFQEAHLQKMVERFKDYISNYGKEYITDEKRIQKAAESVQGAVEFVQGLMDQKKKYDSIAVQAFHDSQNFQSALDKGFSEFADGIVQKKEPEYISLYVDDIIKKYSSNEIEDLDPIFDRVMSVFKFLQDKDVFENYYKIHLSKRLLSRSHSQRQKDAEESFIQKLKKACGHHYTSKIEGMFNDINLSRESMEEYTQHTAYNLKDPKIDFHVYILTQSFWPSYSVSKALLPPEMKSCINSFSTYYDEVHAGRKITWQKSLGDGIMLARSPFSKHEIAVTTYQMVLLLLFNQKSEISFKELKEATHIPEKDLKRNVLTLCLGKHKLLVKDDKTVNLNDDEIIKWNARFKSSTIRIRFGLVIAQESSTDSAEDKDAAERIPEVEKAIVKFMKSKKKCSYNELIEGTLSQLENIKPSQRELKRRVESLIERDFLERDQEDRKIIVYSA